MKIIHIAITCFLSLVLFSCKKYQDGPYLSLRSKNARLINSWECSSARTFNAVGFEQITDERVLRSLNLKEDGLFDLYFTRVDIGGFVDDSISGDWILGQNKEALEFDCSIRFSEEAPYDSLFYLDINRLTSSRLRLLDANNDEYEFIPAN